MRRIWAAVFVALLSIDRLTKHWAVNYLALAEGGSKDAWPGVFGWKFARNTGAAFNIFADNQVLLLIIASLIVCAVLICVATQKWITRPVGTGLVLIAAGGLGNVIDRVMYGYVADFIELQFVRFAIFNFADICITVGVAVVIVAILGSGRRHKDIKGRVEG